jgi:hypothetical protein
MSRVFEQVTAERARAIAEVWIRDWNGHDLEAILGHYAEELEFTSPRAVARMNRPDGTLRSKAELREYFGGALRDQPDLRFELVDCLAGLGTVSVYYRNHRGQRVVETMHLNPEGKVARATVQYA